MPTNDERREVAARLQRIIGKCKYYYPLCLLYNEIIGGNCEAVGRNVEECDNECFDSLLARLADLIEPTVETCEADLTDVIEARVAVREYECSKCGMSWETVWAYDFSYCPYCGRMIENADE